MTQDRAASPDMAKNSLSRKTKSTHAAQCQLARLASIFAPISASAAKWLGRVAGMSSPSVRRMYVTRWHGNRKVQRPGECLLWILAHAAPKPPELPAAQIWCLVHRLCAFPALPNDPPCGKIIS